jgi:hypothetical protein
VKFALDLIRNMHRPGVESRFSLGFGRSLVETDPKVRSLIAVGTGCSAGKNCPAPGQETEEPFHVG